MPKRLYIYIGKSDSTQAIARIDEQAAARAEADAYLGLANWTEYDLTGHVLPACGQLVNVARERAQTADGTGRWRWRTIANVLKRWLGEAVDEQCENCGQRWPAT